ncbi:hypothetical protein ACG873_30260 [Mesorhizobium sp. AaZ16]|uniref:hypothetical protein n=1 Tax=Mesorhizobium sp. AaZ16 TaxID=3402289 RepID=UPI00374FBF9D
MPLKRRALKARRRITPEAVAAYRAADWQALYFALDMRPWEISPLDVHDGRSPYPAGSGGAESWPTAQKLRIELEAANRDR